MDTSLSDKYLQSVETMSKDELDSLPVGVITMTSDGTIKRFNKYEAELGRKDQHAVIATNFFKDVAPCTAVPEFQGRFAALAAQPGAGVEKFDFVFKFAWGNQRVNITFLKRAQSSDVDVLVARVNS